MNESGASDLFETAARATINERCASAFLHDVRGSMQALFSAFELLGRSARLGGGDKARVEKACDLARRAITQHEKSTMDILEVLTLKQSASTTLDLAQLVQEVVHFLRNEAAARQIRLKLELSEAPVLGERRRLQSMVIGLLTAAIDAAAAGAAITIQVERVGKDAIFALSPSHDHPIAATLSDKPDRDAMSAHVAFRYARQLLGAHGGRLLVDEVHGAGGTIRAVYPCSLAASHVSASEK